MISGESIQKYTQLQGKQTEKISTSAETKTEEIKEKTLEIENPKKRVKLAEEVNFQTEKKAKKEKQQVQTLPIIIEEYESEPRSKELSTSTKINVRRRSNVRSLSEEKIKLLEDFFNNSDLR